MNDDLSAYSGAVFLVVMHADGTEGQVPLEIAADGTWSYLVPEDVIRVAGRAVAPGNTVHGKMEISEI